LVNVKREYVFEECEYLVGIILSIKIGKEGEKNNSMGKIAITKRNAAEDAL
jgi:hypothetical protein